MSLEPRYVSILKNLRGVIYFSEGEEILEKIKWINRHFRYRYVGISENILQKVEDKKIKQVLSKKPFIQLYYPSENIKRFIQFFVEIIEENSLLLESLLLSSCYVSPLFVLGEKALQQCESFAIHFLEVSEKLDDKKLKRHLRIADYGVIDIHEKTTHQAWEVIKEASQYNLKNDFLKAERILESLIENRKELAKTDCKIRYWRLISEGKSEGEKVIIYFDPCALIFNYFKSKRKSKEIAKLIINSKEEVSICLGIVTGFYILI